MAGSLCGSRNYVGVRLGYRQFGQNTMKRLVVGICERAIDLIGWVCRCVAWACSVFYRAGCETANIILKMVGLLLLGVIWACAFIYWVVSGDWKMERYDGAKR